MVKLKKQYNKFTKEFVEGTNIHNDKSRKAYYYALDKLNLENKIILDIGCGDGYDINKLRKENNEMHGIDSSKTLVKLAQEKNPKAKIILGNMNKLPYKNETFDAILSKYAIQTSTNIPKVLSEIDRVLKPGGSITYLVNHPIRQFLEKKKHPKNYFKQEIVKSKFFRGKVYAMEPTHTMNEYLNTEFLKKYKITHFKENEDFPSSEQIEGDTYPCFFVLQAIKNN